MILLHVICLLIPYSRQTNRYLCSNPANVTASITTHNEVKYVLNDNLYVTVSLVLSA